MKIDEQISIVKGLIYACEEAPLEGWPEDIANAKKLLKHLKVKKIQYERLEGITR